MAIHDELVGHANRLQDSGSDVQDQFDPFQVPIVELPRIEQSEDAAHVTSPMKVWPAGRPFGVTGIDQLDPFQVETWCWGVEPIQNVDDTHHNDTYEELGGTPKFPSAFH
jgi:hypothetical protein